MQKAYLITHNSNLKQNFQDYDRIYIWDQYCEHNLFYFLDNKEFLKKIIKLNKEITITTPIFSENWLEKFKIFLNEFTKTKSILINNLEIVINDYWTFNLLINNFKNIEIIWWNFLSWQNKDPFLKNFVDKNKHKNISIDNDFYKDFFEKNNIKKIEMYNVFQWLNIKKDYEINLYYPYVIYSINRYCLNSLINKNKDFLEIVENCEWCKYLKNDDLEMQLKISNKKIIQYYRWNKQMYKNEKLTKNKNITRIIYNYDLIKNDWQ